MRQALIASSFGIHAAIVAGLFVVGGWKLDRLDLVRQPVDLHLVTLPPPESGGGPQKQPTAFAHKQKPRATAIVQPREQAVATSSAVAATGASPEGEGEGEGEGTRSGAGSGTGPGSTDGPCTADCAPPEPVPPLAPAAPRVVPPQLLSGLRVSGETQLQPPDVVKTAMHRDGTSRAVSSFQVCLDGAGHVASTRQLRSSGYAGYDAELARGLGTWRYKPYTLDGRGIAVCSVVTFIYSMK